MLFRGDGAIDQGSRAAKLNKIKIKETSEAEQISFDTVLFHRL